MTKKTKKVVKSKPVKSHQTINHGERYGQALETGIDWATRSIYVQGPFEGGLGYRFIPALHMLDETPGLIKVYISSPGGEADEGFSLYDTMRSLRNPIATIANGCAYSIAALVFQGGTHRIVRPHSRIMMHDAALHGSSSHMTTRDVMELAKEMVDHNGRYYSTLSQRTGISQRQIEEWGREERFFGAEEAVRLGLADSVAADAKEEP